MKETFMKLDIFKGVKDLELWNKSEKWYYKYGLFLLSSEDMHDAMSVVAMVFVISWGGDVEVVDKEVGVFRAEDGVVVAVLFSHGFVAC